MQTQNQQILKHLQTVGSITPIDALNLYGCFRLSGRIYDLKKQGIKIETKHETSNGKTYARYVLDTENK